MKPNLICYRFKVTVKDDRNRTRKFMLNAWAGGYEKAWHEICDRTQIFVMHNSFATYTNIEFVTCSMKEFEEYEIL